MKSAGRFSTGHALSLILNKLQPEGDLTVHHRIESLECLRVSGAADGTADANQDPSFDPSARRVARH